MLSVPALRAAVALLGGSLAVHELRYAFAYGQEAESALAHHGHGYLANVTAVVGVLIALVLGRALAAVANGQAQAPRVGLRKLWLVSSAALLAVYCGQELLEGVFASGHPGGATGVVQHGGILAVPISLAVGGAIALIVRVARAIQGVQNGVAVQFVVLLASAGTVWHRARIARPVGRLLADHLAGRAPPAASTT